MKIRKNEIATGLLVIVTAVILVGALIFLGMPGIITPMNTHRVYFDNAKGVRPGAPVLLAGRQIGKVASLDSPVPFNQRPANHPDYEVVIEIRVDKEARIYNNATVLLAQESLMGQMQIDFVKGDENTGRVKNGQEFIGKRVPDLTESMSAQIERLTGPDSDLAATIVQVRELMEKINQPEVTDIIRNAKELTGSAKEVMDRINRPELDQMIRNTEEMTDTLKREPWRILWPSTKKYGDEKEAGPAEFKTSTREKDSPPGLRPKRSTIGTK